MTQKQPVRRGLGRGLGSLIPTAPEEAPTDAGRAARSDASTASPGDSDEVSPAAVTSQEPVRVEPNEIAGAHFAELILSEIHPNARQPRQVFESEAMAELVHSITEIGLLQPVVVRPDGEGYELVMGERRWRAAQEAGLEKIPAIVRSTGDNDMLRDALLENLHRSQLNPLEEASAYAQMLEDFGCTHDELSQRIGRSRPQISNTLRLLKLSPAVQRRVAAGVLSAGHARSLLTVEDSDLQDRLAQRVVSEGISVRGLEEIVAMGEHPRTTRASRTRPVDPDVSAWGERLGDRLETRVKIDLGRSKGKLTVEFASVEDLQRIVDLIDPPE